MSAINPDDLARLAALLRNAPWKFAHTMPENPHEYTLARRWVDRRDFIWACRLIRLHGFLEWWPDVDSGYPYVCLDLDGHHYWTMGGRLEYCVLNRKKLGGP